VIAFASTVGVERGGTAAWHSSLAPTRKIRRRMVSTVGGSPSGNISSSKLRTRR
jgi:hypothetical protein